MGHSEIGVTMNVYGHLFHDKQEKLTNDLDALVERTRNTPPPRRRGESRCGGVEEGIERVPLTNPLQPSVGRMSGTST